MTRDTQAIQDDIAYLRGLAHEGRQAPLLAGPILVTAGVIFGSTSLIHWAIQSGVLRLNPWFQLWIWVVAGAVFAVALTILIGRIKTKPGVRSAGNKAVGAAWEAVGYGIFVTWLALVAMALKTGNWSWMSVMPTAVLVAYGSAWMIGAAMTRTRWMSMTALAAYVGAVAVAWFVGSPLIYPVYAVVLFAVALVPGLILMRQEPAEIV
ncbi:MAG: hypothetical protein P0Y50_06260 [Candidatus Brevundimonas colombiensis]|uniref:Uncharacterized protein n=1 Tax=Candidatus Brevundimonas colombiensis TaxID=3121376 RepID=A0AAJ5X226_9CAUL|nr:hypothetical protein [Brevundimonas sp.]WEK41206.1 MAG: hypothetical protein P0Y50_06260 [Brevundimonas sp.]